ncbi:hypothetical protein AKJ66_01945 [candidate division MSBL1 archaeon SCGC-AAA259E22]|uniref:SpoVT-AbrB domain-containing protein n=1 Tax=candidate division MSBL1 archaeon SCGC-AAA259E22 TaxID=1698265 RepID=A0A133UGX1_9EURY|nr:hypothetical protein AKJ66_01945 [candidate division MSBL1 archaeon SCGC-AAA259E22]
MEKESPKEDLYIKRNPSNGQISYDLRECWYESESGGMKENYLGKAKLSDIVNPKLRSFNFRLFCEIVREKIERLITNEQFLKLHEEWSMDEDEWKKASERVHDDLPLVLATVLRKFDDKKQLDVLRRSFECAIHDMGWEEEIAKGQSLPSRNKWNINALSDKIPKAFPGIDLPSEPSIKDLVSVVEESKLFSSLSTPPPPGINGTLGEVEVGKKGRITIPQKVREKWNMQKGDKIPIRATPSGIELALAKNKFYSPTGDIKNPRGEFHEMTRFLNSLYFHLLKESELGPRRIREVKGDIEQWVGAYDQLSEEEKALLYSTFHKCLPVRLMLQFSEEIGRSLGGEKPNDNISKEALKNLLEKLSSSSYLPGAFIKKGGEVGG